MGRDNTMAGLRLDYLRHHSWNFLTGGRMRTSEYFISQETYLHDWKHVYYQFYNGNGQKHAVPRECCESLCRAMTKLIITIMRCVPFLVCDGVFALKI